MKTLSAINHLAVEKMSLSKRLVFAFLNRLQHGYIHLHEVGNDYYFGDKQADVTASITILNPKAYRSILFGGSIGAAETYVEGLWTSNELTSIVRIFSRNLPQLEQHEKRFGWLTFSLSALYHRLQRNNKKGSRTNIAAHYDLSNTLYQLFLDPHMQYSSAIYPTTSASLEQAQEHKLHVLCEQLQLTADDHLLEVGTGWGGLACYAAKHYGCQVTTTTISKAQYDIAKQRISEQGLEENITLLFEDYRELNGEYSKIISVEMIEAVGHEFMPEYFQILDRLLKPGGKLLIQAITIEDQRYDQYRSTADFIQRYIFPGGHLPCASEILKHIKEQTNMRLSHFADYGLHYADTLNEWNKRFLSHRETILSLGFSEDFCRLWQYYFSYSEGGFREAAIGLAHIETVKRIY